MAADFDDAAWADQIDAQVNDSDRLASVAATGLVDSELEEVFDRLTRLAAASLRVPWSFVTLVDDRRSFWKSCFGTETFEVEDRQNPVEESFCQYVVATGQPLLIDDARVDPRTRLNPSIVSMGVVAWAGIPLTSADGAVLGTFCVVDTEPREWTANDAVMLETLAGAAASEIRLRIALRLSTESAAKLLEALAVRGEIARRSELLAELGRALSAAFTANDVARIVATTGPGVLGAVFVNIHLLNESGTATCVIYSPSIEQAIVDEYTIIPLTTAMPAATAIATGEPVEATNFDDYLRRWPDVADAARRSGQESSAAWPLFRSDGTIVGALSVGWGAPTDFNPLLRSALWTMSQMCASALERGRVADARSAFLVALHDALLPSFPEVSGAEIAGRYVPSSSEVSLGGDWYDVLALSPSLFAVIIGDVCGHGIYAAATMAQLRGAISAVVGLSFTALAEVFNQTERLRGTDHAFVATISVHLIDVVAGTIRYVSAGHPPAILVHADGSSAILEDGRRPVLGFGEHPSTVGTAAFGPGDVLVAFTDGLVERRGQRIDDGIERVNAIVRDTIDQPAAAVAAVIAERIASSPSDDVAFIVVKRVT